MGGRAKWRECQNMIKTLAPLLRRRGFCLAAAASWCCAPTGSEREQIMTLPTLPRMQPCACTSRRSMAGVSAGGHSLTQLPRFAGLRALSDCLAPSLTSPLPVVSLPLRAPSRPQAVGIGIRRRGVKYRIYTLQMHTRGGEPRALGSLGHVSPSHVNVVLA